MLITCPQIKSYLSLSPLQTYPKRRMANTIQTNLLLLLFTFICAALAIQGSRIQAEREFHQQGGSEKWMNRNARRLMIGSTAPTCTYNECRGCKYKCRAEQVPVEGNDPISSPYHYKCVCHR
ncbi:hypothetical protein ACSBR1_002037 [Camellia fascicularis]